MQVYVLGLVFLSLLVQIAAAVVALRISRVAGRSPAWWVIFLALALMAVRRLVLLVEYNKQGFPGYLLPDEVMALVTSSLLLVGMVLIHGIFQDKASHARRQEVARDEARAEAERLVGVMAATPIPIWIAKDPQCLVIQGNPAAASLLRMGVEDNHSTSAPVGRPLHFRLVQDGQNLVPEEMPMQRAALRGEAVAGEPMDLVFDDGEQRHLMAYATPLRSVGGPILGAVCCMVDVTEIRLVEAALAKAQKRESLGVLSGGIAHDFNNIFQVMLANLEMAQSAEPEEARSQVYLQRLRVGLERASRLSRDILHSSGGDLRRPEYLDLTPLVTKALDRMGLAVTRDLSPNLPRALVDPLLVDRVVEGLVTNALEASSAQGAIRVRTYGRAVTAQELGHGHWPEAVEPGTYAVLEVSDQGHGIDPATLLRVFDPFFSTRDMGRGLGLAAALGIIRGHRGGIQVESIQGVGSVFRIHFPSPEAQEAIPTLSAEGPRAQNLVLLADDEVELRAVMAEMLQDWFGLEVVVASDGQEALEAFRQRPEAFDLVILDATMPRMGGVEAFTAMRELRPGLPGILCSGYALSASRDQAIAQGFEDFLKKPFTSAELEALLKRAMGTELR